MKNKEIEKILNKLKKCRDYDDEILLIKQYGANLLLSYIEQLQTAVKDCKQKLDEYENPDDLTLFYMWLDTKAKDKMKQMETEILKLKQQNQIIAELGEQLKNNRDKAIAREIELSYLTDTPPDEELLKILKGGSDENK